MNIITLMLFNKTLTLFSNASTSVILNAVKTTTSSIVSITNMINSSDVNIQEYNNILTKTDIGFVVSILDILVDEHLTKEHCQTIRIALISLHDILIEIHKDLVLINDAINEHKKKYFCGYRNFKCDCSINKIEINNNILINRYKMLFDLLKLYSNTK